MSVAIPATTPPGTYYLLGCADDTKRITESDEADNCKVSTSQVLIGLPDLVVQTVGNPPAAAEPGKGFAIAATTVNQGTAPALASKTRFYLSVDTVRNSGDKLMSGTAAVDTLLPGSTSRTFSAS